MRKLDEKELKKKLAVKIARTMIRLEQSVAGDEKMNEAIPALEEHIDSLDAGGKGWSLNLPTLELKALEPGDEDDE